MCISNNAYDRPRVDFKDTILYGGVVRNPAGEIEHVLAYYNKVAAVAGTAAAKGEFGWDVTPAQADEFGWDIAPKPRRVGNAMLFAVPAVPGTLNGADNLIAVSDFPHFMQDYKTALAPRGRGATRSKGLSFGTLGADAEPVVVKGFDNGTYDVVIAPGGALQIAQVINAVDEDKRPQLNENLYAELNTVYPNFTFVLFCFSEADAEQAGCAMIRYKPQFPHLLYLPGLDGHNGFIERGNVALNHTLVVGSYKMKNGIEVDFTDAQLQREPHGGGFPGGMGLTAPRPTRPYYILPNIVGRTIAEGTQAPQGDFLFSVEDVEAGRFRCRRQVPPGWKNLADKPADPAGGAPWYITATNLGPTGRA